MKTKAKIIKLRSVELYELLQRCQKRERKAQQALYDLYAPLFLGICQRYMPSKEDAEDAMLSSFQTIFSKVNSFKSDGSFEGWMKRIVVNTCLMELRKKRIKFDELQTAHLDQKVTGESAVHSMIKNEILALLEHLPIGYRVVFNMYAIEGYKHREIAEILGISINTSKSQLIQARKRLQDLYNQLNDNQGNENITK